MAFISILPVRQIIYIDLSILPFFTPEHPYLLLCQIHLVHYNAGVTTLLHVPILQKLLLPQEFLVPHRVKIRLVAFCTIDTTYALLYVGSSKGQAVPVFAYTRPLYLSLHAQPFRGIR